MLEEEFPALGGEGQANPIEAPDAKKCRRWLNLKTFVFCVCIILVVTFIYFGMLGNQYSVTVNTNPTAVEKTGTETISGTATLNGGAGTGSVDLTVTCGGGSYVGTFSAPLDGAGAYSATNSDFSPTGITGTDGSCSANAVYHSASATATYTVYTPGNGQGSDIEPENIPK